VPAAGATEIICNDAHGAMSNLDPEKLRGRATYVSGRHKPLYMMQGCDSSADAVLFVGYHGSISGESSVLSPHPPPLPPTRPERDLPRAAERHRHRRERDQRAGGAGQPDPGSAHLRRPADRSRGLAVLSFSKTSSGETLAYPLRRLVAAPPEAARELIKADAEAGVKHAAAMPLPDITLPAALDVDLQTADMADVASWVKGAERTGTRTVRITGDDPLGIYRSFVVLTNITRVAEGR